MTPRTLPEVPAAAHEAGAAAETPSVRRGWLGRLRRMVLPAVLCASALGSGAALAATIV